MKSKEGYRVGKVVSRTKVDSPVKGGCVVREADTGRFMEVRSQSGTFRASDQSEIAIGRVSSKRRDALKRLADR